MAPRVVITRTLPPDCEARASLDFDCLRLDGDLSRLPEAAQGGDGILLSVADPFPAPLIESLPASVRVLANFGVGTDHIDLEAAKARGLIVTNTPGVLTDATAEIAMLLMLGAARRANEGMAEVREATWPTWSPTHMMGTGLNGKRLGILGMGRIGQAVAARARAFGMDVQYHNRSRLAPGQEAGATWHETLPSLLRVSDVLSLHCAATPETRDIINKQTLAQLPLGAILINTARGDIVDDDAVIAAATSGQLSAIGLDVFKGEPNIDHRYRALPNAFLLPHLGSATVETRTAMGMLAIDNLVAVFEGREPPTNAL